MPRELVTKSNSLIKASYSLSLVEQRLVLLAITQAKDTITERTELEITAQHYADVFGLDLSTAYTALKDGADDLFERQFSFIEKDKHGNPKVVKSRWVSQVAYKDSEGYVSLKFSPAVIPFTIFDKQTSSRVLTLIACMSSYPLGKTVDRRLFAPSPISNGTSGWNLTVLFV